MQLITLKLHVFSAFLSLALFIFRAVFSYKKPQWVNAKWLHFSVMGSMGTVLITAAILCTGIGMYPLADSWLTEKALGLFAYVVLGIMAVRPSIAGVPRAFLISAAVMMFVLTYVIARHHMPIVLSF